MYCFVFKNDFSNLFLPFSQKRAGQCVSRQHCHSLGYVCGEASSQAYCTHRQGTGLSEGRLLNNLAAHWLKESGHLHMAL